MNLNQYAKDMYKPTQPCQKAKFFFFIQFKQTNVADNISVSNERGVPLTY